MRVAAMTCPRPLSGGRERGRFGLQDSLNMIEGGWTQYCELFVGIKAGMVIAGKGEFSLEEYPDKLLGWKARFKRFSNSVKFLGARK